VSEQQNLSSTEGWSPQSLRFSFPKTAGTNALLGVCTEPLQLLDFSGDFVQSVIEQTAYKTNLVIFQIFMEKPCRVLWCFLPESDSQPQERDSMFLHDI
jgi:hypothetical protein